MMRALRETLLANLAHVIPRGSRVALVDFPRHTNVGDSAIWLGGRALLRQIQAKIVYFADMSQYHCGRMRSLLGDGIVVIHGGGNVGDLWPDHQAFRERVMQDFRDNVIVQFPQGIHFDEPANVPRVRDAFLRHDRFTLLVRDRKSLELAHDALGIDAVLTPDLAFGLWPLRRTGLAVAPYIFQRRTDKEAARLDTAEDGFDWLAEADPVEAWMDDHVPDARRLMRVGSSGVTLYGAWLDRLAALRVRRGLRLLSRGEVVISDRLHGVLLSALAGIPVVALDNRTGKISAFLDTWLSDHPEIEFADNLDDAVRVAKRMSVRPLEGVP